MSRGAGFLGNPNLYWLPVVLVLVLVSYGSYWQRGVYADDFAFLGYLTGQSLPDAIMGWGGHFNSRLTQAVLIPTAFSLVQAATPGEVYWWVIHINAVLTLCVTVYLLFKTLELFQLSRLSIFVATLVFALHPIKTQAVFWPASIFGYLYPLLFFMLGTYLYFRAARSGCNKLWQHALVFFLMFLAACGIEQLIPLIFLVLVARLLIWRLEFKAVLLHGLGSVLLMAMVVGVILAGRTMDRVASHGGMGLSMIWTRLELVLVSAMRELVGYPARFLLDEYFYADVSTAFWSPALLIACMALVLVVVLMMRGPYGPAQPRMRPDMVVMLVGVAAIFLPLTPFLVTDYYMPARVFFIPSIGFALVCGSLFGLLWSVVRARWFHMGLAVLAAVASLVYVLTNRTVQVQYAELWQKEEAVIKHLLQEYPAPEPGTSFSLLHFPRMLGAVPTFADYFTFPGMIQWLYRNETITGKSDMSLSTFLDLDENLDASQPRLWTSSPKQNGIIYSVAMEKAMSLSRLLTINEASLVTGDYRRSLPGKDESVRDSASIAVVTPLAVSVGYTNALGLELQDALWLRYTDLLCVRVTGNAPSESKRLRLLVHASYDNGDVVPYDRDLIERNAFHFSEGKFYADVLIDSASSLRRLEFQMTDSGRVLPLTIDDSSGRTSMTVLIQALSPGITVGIVESLAE